MKIFHLSPFNPSLNHTTAGATKGGVGYAVDALVSGLEEENVLQECFSLPDMILSGTANSLHRQALNLQNQVLYYNLQMFQTVKERAAAQPDRVLIHAHDTLTCLAAGMLKNEFPDIPLIVTLYDTVWGRRRGNMKANSLFYHNLQEFALLRADRITVPSCSVAEECRHCWPALNNRIRIIPYAVDWRLTGSAPSSPEPGNRAPGKEKYIFFIGRLVPEKGTLAALECLRIVRANGFPVRLKIAGMGPMIEKLHQYAQENNLTDIIDFMGAVHGNRKKELMEHAVCQVIPSYYEPFGIVALEAMICNTPVAVFPTGGLKEIVVHRKTGLVAGECTPGALAEEVCRLLESPGWAKQLAAEGRTRCISLYSGKAIAASCRKLYADVVPSNDSAGEC